MKSLPVIRDSGLSSITLLVSRYGFMLPSKQDLVVVVYTLARPKTQAENNSGAPRPCQGLLLTAHRIKARG